MTTMTTTTETDTAARIVNLTPHALAIAGGPTVGPAGPVARCRQSSTPAGVHAGVPHRRDVASPGDLVRDGGGIVVGCRNLIVNA
jgi:hypothetical protein